MGSRATPQCWHSDASLGVYISRQKGHASSLAIREYPTPAALDAREPRLAGLQERLSFSVDAVRHWTSWHLRVASLALLA